MVCPKETNIFHANVMFLILIFTTVLQVIVQEPLPLSANVPLSLIDISYIMLGSISTLDL